jgi:hypothetical protein
MMHLPAEEKDLVIIDIMLMNQFSQLFINQYFDASAADSLIQLADKWKRPHVVEAMRNKIDRINAFKQLLAAVIKCQELLAVYIVPDSKITDEEVVNDLLGVLDDQSLVKLVNLFNN